MEMPTTQQAHRSPLEWAGAMALHIVIVAALIIVPLYTTGTIRLSEYHEIPLVAPPPPLAPPPAPAGGPVAPQITRPKAKLNYTLQKLTAPAAIPKSVSSGSEGAADAAPELGGVLGDRKSTRLNSSHGYISYAVFCLKKKKLQLTRQSISSGPS